MTQVTARAKRLLGIVVAAIAFASHAAAESKVATPQSGKSPDFTCVVLSHYDAQKTAQAFKTFAMPLFGKHPERWTQEDAQNLFRNVAACNGKPENLVPQSRVNFIVWQRMWNEKLLVETLTLSALSMEIAATFKPQWPQSLRMPFCSDLLDWKRDPVWLFNNSNVIFSGSFNTISETEAATVKAYVKACKPIAKAVSAARKRRVDNSGIILDDIISSVDRDQSAQRWSTIEFIPQFMVEHEGRRVPFSYIGPTTQEIVLRLNTSEKNKIPLNQDELAAISKWSSDILRSTEPSPDQEYAKAVKGIVASQLFSLGTP